MKLKFNNFLQGIVQTTPQWFSRYAIVESMGCLCVLLLFVYYAASIPLQKKRDRQKYQRLLSLLRDRQMLDPVLESELQRRQDHEMFSNYCQSLFVLQQLGLLDRPNLQKSLQFDPLGLREALERLQKAGICSDRNCQLILNSRCCLPQEMANAMISFRRMGADGLQLSGIATMLIAPSRLVKVVKYLRHQKECDTYEIITVFEGLKHRSGMDNYLCCLEYLVDQGLLFRETLHRVALLNDGSLYALAMLLIQCDVQKLKLSVDQFDFLLACPNRLEVAEYILNQCVSVNTFSQSNLDALFNCSWLLSERADVVLWRDFPIGRLDEDRFHEILRISISLLNDGKAPGVADFKPTLSVFDRLAAGLFPRKMLYPPVGWNAEVIAGLVAENKLSENSMPASYCCFLSRQVMTNPVRIQTLQKNALGGTVLLLESPVYERDILMLWLKECSMSPYSRQPLDLSKVGEWLVYDVPLKEEICRFVQEAVDGKLASRSASSIMKM